MIRKYCYFVIVGLILIKPTNATITLINKPEGTTVIFSGRTIQDPIGCIYLDDQYLARLSPEDIQAGKKIIKTAKLITKIGGLNKFRITVFTEGVIATELRLETQTSTFDFIRPSNFNYSGESHPIGKLSDFVAEKFAELRRIRARIIAEGAKWKADVNSLFMLPEEEQKMRLGFLPPPGEQGNFPPLRKGPIPVRSYFDWTNKDGYNWMTPIRDQQACGSCWAFGAVGQVEAVIKINTNQPTLDIDLAEQTLVTDGCRWCGDCCGGWHYFALHYIMNDGIPAETDDPYTHSNGPCDKKDSDLYKIQSYTRITWESQDEYAIKGALQNHPLSTMVEVDNAFHAYVSGIYSYQGPSLGQHVIVLVGWDDSQNAWKLKNSWGEDWGINGYMWAVRNQQNKLGWYTFDCNY